MHALKTLSGKIFSPLRNRLSKASSAEVTEMKILETIKSQYNGLVNAPLSSKHCLHEVASILRNTVKDSKKLELDRNSLKVYLLNCKDSCVTRL